MKYFHNIELQDSKITGLIVDPLANDPIFQNSDSGRIYFNSSTQTLRLNNGYQYIDISLPANFNNLIQTLGSNWITQNYTFNPTPYNELNNVSGLNANNSLFDVISQLDHAIKNVNGNSLMSLNDVIKTTPLETGNVIYYNGQNFTFTDINSIISDYGTLSLSNLNDVNLTNLADGNILVYNSASNKFKPASITYAQQDLQSTTAHTIHHTLNVQYCPIIIINAANNTAITDANITFTSINQIDIVLQTAAPIYVVLMATPSFT